MKNKWLLILPLVGCLIFPGILPPAHSQVSVLTHHNDISRSGLNPDETLLTPANVNSSQFGPLFTQAVDGFVVAQPLYVPNVSIPGQGTHNVVYVETQNDSIFAFDAENNQGTNALPLWSQSLLPPGATAVPSIDQGCGGSNVTQFGQIGITGTPVIDPTTNTIYVVAKSILGSTQTFYLHALDITTGEEKFNGPAAISGAVVGAGGTVTFTPRYQLQRPGLLLSNGTVYIAFGSMGCDLYAHGWVFAYSASNVQDPPAGIFLTTPDSTASNEEGSIWQGGGGLPADSSGDVYAMTANGDFDAYLGGNDYGDSFIQLSLGADGFSLIDSFTPYDQQQMRNQDLDLGSGGPILLNNQPGSVPNLVVGAGKFGTIYLLNRSNLGGYNSGGSGDTQIVQWLPSVLGGPMFGTPAYWNNMVYFTPGNSTLKAFSLSLDVALNEMQFSSSPVLQTTKLGGVATPVVSANGTTNGVLWMVQIPPSPKPATLTAWNASTLGGYIYTSPTGTNAFGNLVSVAHFVTPTVANGKVYVGTQTQLVVFALYQALSPAAGNNQTGAIGTTLPIALQVLVADPYSGNVDSGVTVSFSDNGAGGTFGTPSSVTNSSGIATTTYTLPQTAGTITITATGSGGSYSNYGPTQFSEISGAPVPASLTCLGANQSTTAGTPLPEPVNCIVKDGQGNLLSGIPVSFSDNGAGGTFSANPVNTNSSGKASVGYTTPTKSGTVKITASVAGVTPVTISEKNMAGPAAAVNIVSGNNQTGNPGTTLPKALEVSVTDQYSNPVSGVSVGFSDGGAGGTLSSSSVTTNLQGTASVTYTLPGMAETVNVSASVTGPTPAVFTETVE
jgi:Bacterial Ig-like domain (group 1)